MGGVRGDDAGSPAFAKVHIDTTRITRYRPGDAPARDVDNETPLEAIVEQRPINFFGQDHILSLDIRLAMGRQWLKLLDAGGLGTHGLLFVQQYGIDEPDPMSRSDAFITAHAAAWQSVSALAGRAMDGAKLYFYLKADDAHHAYDGIAIPDADKPIIDPIAGRFIAWYEGLFYQPLDSANDAWRSQQLEYQFAVSAPSGGGEKVLVAEEYYQGHLDWYSLYVDPLVVSLSGDGGGPAGEDQTPHRSHAPGPRSTSRAALFFFCTRKKCRAPGSRSLRYSSVPAGIMAACLRGWVYASKPAAARAAADWPSTASKPPGCNRVRRCGVDVKPGFQVAICPLGLLAPEARTQSDNS